MNRNSYQAVNEMLMRLTEQTPQSAADLAIWLENYATVKELSSSQGELEDYVMAELARLVIASGHQRAELFWIIGKGHAHKSLAILNHLIEDFTGEWNAESAYQLLIAIENGITDVSLSQLHDQQAIKTQAIRDFVDSYAASLNSRLRDVAARIQRFI